jgi:EAL domain-containing protein (putative c-di-GMP-specific phosphodiesterase class I)
MARSLGLVTVAEGIETKGQSAVLQSLGCDWGQGYHFSRPLSAVEAGALLHTAL